jgi:Tfp pilus assembly protein PilX
MRLTRLRVESGFTLVTVMGAMLVLALVTAGAFAAVNGDAQESGKDIARKQALAAAEAGVNDYVFHLNTDNNYWASCSDPVGVSDPWDGTGTDPREWQTVPGATTSYAIELLPANGYTKCVKGSSVSNTVIDAGSRSIRIRVTGRSQSAHGTVYRSVIASLKREGFLDFLWFTDNESTDPQLYLINTDARPTSPDVTTWAANQTSGCARYYRNGRRSASYSGRYTDNNTTLRFNGCNEIQFAPQDVVKGPLHTNDELLVCGSPQFGRGPQDQIESGATWRASGGSCPTANPNFQGTWRPNWATIGLPATNASLKAIAGATYTFSGRTTIQLGTPAGKMTVNGVSMDYPSDGVIYVQNSSAGTCPAYNPVGVQYNTTATQYCGDAVISGTYSSSLTIATENDVIIAGDVLQSATDDVLLGLIANGFIRVQHNVTWNSGADCNSTGTQNREIDAAMLTLQHSFMVDAYYCGNPLGTLTVKGVIGQKYRGPVGVGGATPSSGYIKNYNYDDRMQFRAPPHFLDPVQSAWRVWRYTEQQPAVH